MIAGLHGGTATTSDVKKKITLWEVQGFNVTAWGGKCVCMGVEGPFKKKKGTKNPPKQQQKNAPE